MMVMVHDGSNCCVVRCFRCLSQSLLYRLGNFVPLEFPSVRDEQWNHVNEIRERSQMIADPNVVRMARIDEQDAIENLLAEVGDGNKQKGEEKQLQTVQIADA